MHVLALEEASLLCIGCSRFAHALQEFAFFLAEEGDLVDQNEVLVHLGEPVFVADFGLLLDPFAQRLDAVVKEGLLVDVLLLNVRVHLFVLHGLVFHVLVQTVVHCALQLVVVVDVLGYPVDSSFKPLNVALVAAYLQAVHVVRMVELSLFVFQIVHDPAQSGVDLVEVHHLVVH